jgi:hypothetical protein
MCRFWAGGISSFPFSRAREYRLLRRLHISMIDICYSEAIFKLSKRRKIENVVVKWSNARPGRQMPDRAVKCPTGPNITGTKLS